MSRQAITCHSHRQPDYRRVAAAECGAYASTWGGVGKRPQPRLDGVAIEQTTLL